MKRENLTQIREEIDKVDCQIVQLLGERSYFVKQAATFKDDKASVKAADRVETVIQKVRDTARENGANPDLIEKIYRQLITTFVQEEMTELETREP